MKKSVTQLRKSSSKAIILRFIINGLQSGLCDHYDEDNQINLKITYNTLYMRKNANFTVMSKDRIGF